MPAVSLPTTTHQGTGEVGGAQVHRPGLVGADDPDAGRARPVEHLAVRGRPDHRQREQRAGAGPDRARVVGVGGVPGDDQAGWRRTRRPSGPGCRCCPGWVGRSKTTVESGGSSRDRSSAGIADHGEQLGVSSFSPSSATSSGAMTTALARRSSPRARPPRPTSAVGRRETSARTVQPCSTARRDRPHPLHQELAEPVPLGAVVQQRLPLLEPGVAGGDADGHDPRRPVQAGTRRRPCRAASAASCGPWWAAGRRRRCRGCGRSRAGGTGPAARRRRRRPARRRGRCRSTAAQSGRAHSTNAPG